MVSTLCVNSPFPLCLPPVRYISGLDNTFCLQTWTINPRLAHVAQLRQCLEEQMGCGHSLLTTITCAFLSFRSSWDMSTISSLSPSLPLSHPTLSLSSHPLSLSSPSPLSLYGKVGALCDLLPHTLHLLPLCIVVWVKQNMATHCTPHYSDRRAKSFARFA